MTLNQRYPDYRPGGIISNVRRGRNRLKAIIGNERVVYDNNSQFFTCVEHGYSISLSGSINFPAKSIRTIHNNMTIRPS